MEKFIEPGSRRHQRRWTEIFVKLIFFLKKSRSEKFNPKGKIGKMDKIG